MQDIELNDDGDLMIRNYDLSLVEGIDQITQNLAIRLRFFLNDWFLDVTAGIPYYEDIFIKAPNRIRIESVLKDEIVSTDGINEIISFSSEFNSNLRKFSVSFTAETDEGTIDLEVNIP